MNKIIEKLLTVTFPDVKIENLMEIVAATPNPEIATEILCGLYEEKTTCKTKVLHERNGVLTFISYNKWDNSVTYTYEEILKQGSYFPKGTKKEDVTIETIDSMKCSSEEKDAVYLYIPTGKTRENKSHMSFETWIALPIAE